MTRLPDCAAIILDKDGTVTDSHAYWGYIIEQRARLIASACSDIQMGKEALEIRLERCMGWNRAVKRLDKQGPIAIKSRSEVIDIVNGYLQSLGCKIGTEELSGLFDAVQASIRTHLKNYVRPIPEAIEFIKRARRAGITLCLVTSDKTQNAHEAMKICGVEDCFDLILGGDLGYGDKCMGGPAQHACKEIGKKPEDVICIGDAKMDWEMYKNANLSKCILVATGQTPLEELSKIGGPVVESLSSVEIK